MPTHPYPSEWMRGVLGLVVLAVLAEGPTYGYAIAQALEQRGFGVVKGGTLYPLLARLEDAGHLSTTWRAGDGGPGRKYYELTDTGATELRSAGAHWVHFAQTVQSALPDPGRSVAPTPTHDTHIH